MESMIENQPISTIIGELKYQEIVTELRRRTIGFVMTKDVYRPNFNNLCKQPSSMLLSLMQLVDCWRRKLIQTQSKIFVTIVSKSHLLVINKQLLKGMFDLLRA